MTAVATRSPAPAAVRESRTPENAFAGLGTAVRLVVRRNRVRLVVWVYVVVGLFAYVGSYYRTILDSQPARGSGWRRRS